MNTSIHNLIVRVLSKNGTEQDQAQLDAWLSKSPDNLRDYEALKKLWNESASLKREREADVDAAWLDLQARIQKAGAQQPAAKTSTLRMVAGLALVAMLAVLIAFVLDNGRENNKLASIEKGPVYLSDNSDALQYDTISFLDDSLLAQTPDSTLPTKPKLRSKNTRNVVMITYTTVDSAKAFYLPDNSIVFLNDHSSLSYAKDFGTHNRTLNLSGEAYFEPLTDSIPFIVNCANTSAKGGAKSFFNVHENRTTGSVDVLTVSGTVEFTGVTNKVYKKLIINEGERAVYGKDASLLKEKNKQKDYKWWQKKNLRAKLRSLFDRIKNAFK